MGPREMYLAAAIVGTDVPGKLHVHRVLYKCIIIVLYDIVIKVSGPCVETLCVLFRKTNKN